jgi:hypothetical protein
VNSPSEVSDSRGDRSQVCYGGQYFLELWHRWDLRSYLLPMSGQGQVVAACSPLARRWVSGARVGSMGGAMIEVEF